MHKIDTQELMRQAIGEVNPMASKKIYRHLNERMQDFIRKSPLMMISSVDEMGFPTISPKGGEPGFVNISDKNTLLVPELRGNKLAFSLSNILKNDKVALIFVVPDTNELLRVHGQCRLFGGELLCQQLAPDPHRALLALEVTVLSAYFHCGRAFLRSQVWLPDTWAESIKISFGKEIAENVGVIAP